MQRLSMNFSEPDIRLTQKQIDGIVEKIHGADREQTAEIIKNIGNNMINKYYEGEFARLEALAVNPKYKLTEVQNTVEGILMRLTPSKNTSGGMRKRKGKKTYKKRKSKGSY
jgi:hypothetical protein